MTDRHWVIVYNALTDECRFMQLDKEWLQFKYDFCDDREPEWQQLGFYETRDDAYSAFINFR